MGNASLTRGGPCPALYVVGIDLGTTEHAP